MRPDGVTDSEHKQREPRHFYVHAGEDALELRNHPNQQQSQNAHGDEQHGHRIEKGGLDLALDFLRLFGKFSQAFQHHFQHAAQLAGLDHVDEQAVEHLGVLGERLGKGAATFDGQRQIAENAFERDITLLFFEHAQAAQQRQPRIHKCRQLPRERRQHLRLDLAGEEGDFDFEAHRPALLFAAGLGGLGGRLGFFAGGFFLGTVSLDNLRGEQTHFLHPADGLVLAGNLDGAFGFLTA